MTDLIECDWCLKLFPAELDMAYPGLPFHICPVCAEWWELPTE